MKLKDTTIRLVTIFSLAYLVCWGTAMVFFPLKPFWRDEWCLIYNLKFKDAGALWGQLDFTQQFPRIHLQLLKMFTSSLNYSYFSLRLPSFVIGVLSIALSYRLKDRLFPGNPLRYLFVLLIAANPMFLNYLGQMKHYEMELFMSLVALWQFLELMDIPANNNRSVFKYLLLTATLFCCPFFSYTYTIALMPALFIAFLRGLVLKQKGTALLLIPLTVTAISCYLFYLLDAKQLMSDSNMHAYWAAEMGSRVMPMLTALYKIWQLFAKVGAGFVFEIVLGITGISSFVYAVTRLSKISMKRWGTHEWLLLYAAALVVALTALFLAGRLPIGDAKFTLFATPALAILIVNGLSAMMAYTPANKTGKWFCYILLAAFSGNIVTSCLQVLTSPEYKRRLAIYRATNAATKLAYEKHLPVVVTNEIGYPDDISARIPFISMPDAAGVLKTCPEYKVAEPISVLSIRDTSDMTTVREIAPAGIPAVILCYGETFRIVRW